MLVQGAASKIRVTTDRRRLSKSKPEFAGEVQPSISGRARLKSHCEDADRNVSVVNNDNGGRGNRFEQAQLHIITFGAFNA